jgi:hypothetical protein
MKVPAFAHQKEVRPPRSIESQIVDFRLTPKIVEEKVKPIVKTPRIKLKKVRKVKTQPIDESSHVDLKKAVQFEEKLRAKET